MKNLPIILFAIFGIATSADANDSTPLPPAEAPPLPAGAPMQTAPIPQRTSNCVFSNDVVGFGSRTFHEAVLQFKIGTDGTVKDIVINQSSGSSIIDGHISACASSWTYTPATQDGAPIESRWEADFDWAPFGLTVRQGPARGGHRCGAGWYPQSPLKMMIGGKTTLNFTITKDGAVQGVSIKESSGNADLDEAASQCVSTWRYQPALRDGHPVDVSWAADVVWTPMPTFGRPHTCPHYYPKDLAHAGTEGEVRLAFIVTDKGMVTEVRIAKSSGNSQFDDAAAACAQTWRYRPAVRNGRVVSTPWEAKVRFDIVPHPANYAAGEVPVETVVVLPD